jgi:hypothetical protein
VIRTELPAVTQWGQEAMMASKNKGGRETRKPKAQQNVKATGQTPGPTAVDAINHKVRAKG